MWCVCFNSWSELINEYYQPVFCVLSPSIILSDLKQVLGSLIKSWQYLNSMNCGIAFKMPEL